MIGRRNTNCDVLIRAKRTSPSLPLNISCIRLGRRSSLTPSSFGYIKYLRRSTKYQGICDAEECRKLAVCFRSEAGYLEISFKQVKITQVTYLHGKKFGDRNVYKVLE